MKINPFQQAPRTISGALKPDAATRAGSQIFAAMPILALQQDAEEASDSENSESRLQEIGRHRFLSVIAVGTLETLTWNALELTHQKSNSVDHVHSFS